MMTSFARSVRYAALAVLVVVAIPAAARAQDSYFIPFVGTVTGGDTRNGGLTYGFSTIYIDDSGWGGELDVAHSNKFNDIDFVDSGLTTAMINILGSPKVSPYFKPYAGAGFGLIRARGCIGPDCVREISRTDFGIDIAGGALVPFSEAFGVRGDIRYFRYMQIHQDLPRTEGGQFDFWRLTIGGYFSW